VADDARSRGEPSAPPPAAANRLERREQAARDVLRALVRDFYRDRFGPRPARDVGMTLSFRLRPDAEWETVFDPPLTDQLREQLEDGEAARAIYRPGRLFSFRAATSEAPECAPPDPLHVFAGYDPTGAPRWAELAQVLIDLRDERVERLFDDAGGIAAVVRSGRELREDQLASYGRASKSYAILGQVAAGYFRVATGRRGPEIRLALTFQAVEIRRRDGAPDLKLNLLGAEPDGAGSLADFLVSDRGAWVARSRDQAEAALTGIARQVRELRERGESEAARERMRSVPGVLRRLAQSLERGARQSGRRSRHAEVRRRERRPVHKAWDDLRDAKPEELYHDEKAGTVVVCTGRGRAHVFNYEGRHVTSLEIRHGPPDYKIRTGKWRPLTGQERERFRRGLARGGDDEETMAS
jgi:hypothetical protein